MRTNIITRVYPTPGPAVDGIYDGGFYPNPGPGIITGDGI